MEPFDESTESINNAKNVVNNEESMEEHEKKLFEQISDITIGILTDENTKRSYNDMMTMLEKYIKSIIDNNPDLLSKTNFIKSLIEIISVGITMSVYNSIAYYDMGIKQRLSDNFINIASSINNTNTEINILKTKLGNIEKQLLTSKIQDMIDKD